MTVQHASICTVVMAVAWVCLGDPGGDIGSDPLETDETWRGPRYSAVNTLYCFLKALGVKPRYGELVKAHPKILGKEVTLYDLANISSEHEVRLDVVKLDPKGLVRANKPVIAHIEGRAPEVGALLLIVKITRRKVHYVNGPTGSMCVMQRGQFFRIWSGFALTKTMHRGVWRPGWLIGMAISLSVGWSLAGRMLRKREGVGMVKELLIRSKGLGCKTTVCLLGLATAWPLAVEESKGEDTNGLVNEAFEKLEVAAGRLNRSRIEFTLRHKGPIADEYGAKLVRYAVAFNDGKVYEKSVEVQDRGMIARILRGEKTWTHENGFDGTHFYFGDPERGDPRVPASLAKYSIRYSDDPNFHTDTMRFPYLFAASWIAPKSVADLKTSPRLESMVVKHWRKADSKEVSRVDGKLEVRVIIPDPVVLEARKTDPVKRWRNLKGARNAEKLINKELGSLRRLRRMDARRQVLFVLDPSKGYGVTKRVERTADGRLIARIETQGWRRFQDGGVWLPGHVEKTWFARPYVLSGFGKEPLIVETFDLTSAKFGEVGEAVFNLEEKSAYEQAGTLIRDRVSPEAREHKDHEVQYRISADVADVAESANEVLFWRYAPWIGGGLAVITGAIFFGVRRIRRRRV